MTFVHCNMIEKTYIVLCEFYFLGHHAILMYVGTVYWT